MFFSNADRSESLAENDNTSSPVPSPRHETNLSVAIVGQPNGGKSTLFRLLTRIHQEVSNYPGVTIDARSGHYHEGNRRIEIVDLPGTYSFTATTPEERIAKNFILLDRPEVVLVVVDATHFRRHLSLVLELLEMQIPLVVCLNFMDVARRRGIQFDCERLAKILDSPVIPFVATKGEGVNELRQAIIEVGDRHEHNYTPWQIEYDAEISPFLDSVEKAIRTKDHLTEDFSPRWLAVKLLENDREARRIVEHHTHDDTWPELLDFCDEQLNRYIEEYRKSPKKTILETRNCFAEQINRETRSELRARTIRFSDRVDRYICHPIFGTLFLLFVMILIFQLTFQIADGWSWLPVFSTGPFQIEWTTPVAFLSYIFHSWLPDHLIQWFHWTDPTAISLLRHGILAGAGGVIQFVPVIFVMFTILAILELSGYIARVAMIMDSFMRMFHLQGRSILPMVLGGGLSGGCAVPAIMATRSMPNIRGRILTMLVIPMLNCGGKIPVYAMLVSAFFSAWQGVVMTGIIFFSWLVALLTAWFLGNTVLKGKELPLLLELPSYQFPLWRDVFASSSRQSWEFLKKAGTVILAANIFLWFLMTFPKPPEEASAAPVSSAAIDQSRLEHSYAALFGKMFEPVSQWAGFDWKDNIAFIGGVAAKELIVSSMITLYLAEDQKSEANSNNAQWLANDETTTEKNTSRLTSTLSQLPGWSARKALAMLVFIMLYAPCIGTLVAMYRTTGTWRWPFFSLIYNTVFAFLVAVAIFRL